MEDLREVIEKDDAQMNDKENIISVKKFSSVKKKFAKEVIIFIN